MSIQGNEGGSPAERLVLEDIHYWRGDTQVLRGISWKVSAGEHWAVLGPNGSGKTTLMKIATGYIGSSQGRTFLLEGWIHSIPLPEVRKRVGFVSPSLSDHLVRWWEGTTGLEVVLSGRYAMVGPKKKASANEKAEARALLERGGFGYLAEAKFATMSSGERQVCLIARSQMACADLRIYDEPCAGLDLANREMVLKAIAEACREAPNNPQILITHHTEEIVAGMTHVLLLKEGQVVAQGPKEIVLTEDNLCTTFGIPIRLLREEGRAWALPRNHQ